jgi:hypothetical protein
MFQLGTTGKMNEMNCLKWQFPSCVSRRPGEARNYALGGGKN